MGGFFGTIAKHRCTADLFYGTDYNSHLGTRSGGLVTYNQDDGSFARSIHKLDSDYFRSKFEDELDKFKGNSGTKILFCIEFAFLVEISFTNALSVKPITTASTA